MRESDLRRQVQASLPAVHWQAIETGGTGRGIPDLNGCYQGREFWVELKLVKRGQSVCLSPMQVAWHCRRHRAGGATWVFVRRLDTYYLYWGGDVQALAEHGLRFLPVMFWPVSGMDWMDLLGRLVGETGRKPAPPACPSPS